MCSLGLAYVIDWNDIWHFYSFDLNMTSTGGNGTNAGNDLSDLMKTLDDTGGDIIDQILKDFDVNDMNIDDILNESSVRQIIRSMILKWWGIITAF